MSEALSEITHILLTPATAQHIEAKAKEVKLSTFDFVSHSFSIALSLAHFSVQLTEGYPHRMIFGKDNYWKIVPFDFGRSNVTPTALSATDSSRDSTAMAVPIYVVTRQVEAIGSAAPHVGTEPTALAIWGMDIGYQIMKAKQTDQSIFLDSGNPEGVTRVDIHTEFDLT